jgi:hypothetical protein
LHIQLWCARKKSTVKPAIYSLKSVVLLEKSGILDKSSVQAGRNRPCPRFSSMQSQHSAAQESPSSHQESFAPMQERFAPARESLATK